CCPRAMPSSCIPTGRGSLYSVRSVWKPCVKESKTTSCCSCSSRRIQPQPNNCPGKPSHRSRNMCAIQRRFAKSSGNYCMPSRTERYTGFIVIVDHTQHSEGHDFIGG